MSFKFPSVLDAYYNQNLNGNLKKRYLKKKEQYHEATLAYDELYFKHEALVGRYDRKDEKYRQLKEKVGEYEMEARVGNQIKLEYEENLSIAASQGFMRGLSASYPYFVETRPRGFAKEGSLFPAKESMMSITEAFENSGLKEYPVGFLNKTKATPFYENTRNSARLKSKDIEGIKNTGKKIFEDKERDIDYYLWHRPGEENVKEIKKSEFYKNLKLTNPQSLIN